MSETSLEIQSNRLNVQYSAAKQAWEDSIVSPASAIPPVVGAGIGFGVAAVSGGSKVGWVIGGTLLGVAARAWWLRDKHRGIEQLLIARDRVARELWESERIVARG